MYMVNIITEQGKQIKIVGVEWRIELQKDLSMII